MSTKDASALTSATIVLTLAWAIRTRRSEPDVRAGADEALTAAHSAALQRLASVEADTAWKRTLLWARAAVLARANPVDVKPETLQGYAGEYDLRHISYEQGRLWYRRENRPREALTPIHERTFAGPGAVFPRTK